jgi:hypothetical protein
MAVVIGHNDILHIWLQRFFWRDFDTNKLQEKRHHAFINQNQQQVFHLTM